LFLAEIAGLASTRGHDREELVGLSPSLGLVVFVKNTKARGWQKGEEAAGPGMIEFNEIHIDGLAPLVSFLA